MQLTKKWAIFFVAATAISLAGGVSMAQDTVVTPTIDGGL